MLRTASQRDVSAAPARHVAHGFRHCRGSQENAGVSPETDAILFAPLREALQRADARWRNGPAPTPPAPIVDPTKK